MGSKMRIAVIASGSGSDFQSIIDGVGSGFIGNAEIVCLLCNVQGAFCMERAKKHNIPAHFIDHRKKKREDFEKEMLAILDGYGPDLVVMAGFMRITTPTFVKPLEGRLMNIHPALLPSFLGTHGALDAFNWGVKVSGCTVHFVDTEVDHGPIIMQKAVEVREDDTVETLKDRILKEEHKVLPWCVKMFCEGKLKVDGRKVRILGTEPRP